MLLPFNERVGHTRPTAGNRSRQLLAEEQADKVFPDFATVSPNFPLLPYRHEGCTIIFWQLNSSAYTHFARKCRLFMAPSIFVWDKNLISTLVARRFYFN